MSDPSGTIHIASDGGIAGEHIPLPAPPAFLAPTISGKERNTIKTNVVPFACWRADDVRFEFDLSFIFQAINEEINALDSLIKKHTLPNAKGEMVHKPVLSVFGHADPSGNDDYNKALSGRRAQAMYGLLTRNVDLWEDLFSTPHGNDDWNPGVLIFMLISLDRPTDPKPAGAAARKALYKDYMDLLCTIRGNDGKPVKGADGQPERLVVAKGDFLGAGTDGKFRVDFQGCGEFNPILSFSKEEDREFSKKENKAARDMANAPNRRVVVYLYRPGVHIRAADWPCPAAKDGVAGCKKRFWSDGEKRRSPQDERREYKDTKDTFACRFYDRLTANSPCERILEQFRIRLFDPTGRPLPGAPFLIQVAGRSIPGQANQDGDAIVQHLTVPATCNVFWSRPDDKAPKPSQPADFQFFKSINVVIEEPEKGEKTEAAGKGDRPDEASVKRLENLGYTRHPDLTENIRDFQMDLGKTGDGLTGRIADIRDELKARHDSLNPPLRTRRTGA